MRWFLAFYCDIFMSDFTAIVFSRYDTINFLSGQAIHMKQVCNMVNESKSFELRAASLLCHSHIFFLSCSLQNFFEWMNENDMFKFSLLFTDFKHPSIGWYMLLKNSLRQYTVLKAFLETFNSLSAFGFSFWYSLRSWNLNPDMFQQLSKLIQRWH